MQRYTRPKKPPKFESRMEPYRRELRCAIERGSVSGPIKGRWGDFKKRLCEAQFGKCGCCDAKVNTVSFGDVEHFRPKSAVSTLDRSSSERGGRPLGCRKKDRRIRKICTTGYWWLAFSWRNYLYACPRCNQEWKSTLFPVCDEHRRPKPPARGCRETPLLLHPYEGCGRNPVKHLFYRHDGTVEPRNGSKWGKATIEVCGLNRDSLREARREKASKAWQLIDELQRAPGPLRVRDALRRLRKLGRQDLQFSGVVRTILEQNTKLSWKELTTLSSEPEAVG